MGGTRNIRVAELLKQRLSGILLRQFSDEIGFTTITDVVVSPDLRDAAVYYSVLGSEEEKKRTALVLARAVGFINSDIGKHMHIKFTPKVRFKYDATPAKASRVYELLDKLEEERIEYTEQVPEAPVENKKDDTVPGK
jgi:ribosome-binding factor A